MVLKMQRDLHFIEKNGKVYFSSIYKNISKDDTLEEIKEYIKQKRKELL